MSDFIISKDKLNNLRTLLSEMTIPLTKPAYAMVGPCSSGCSGDCWSCSGSCQGDCKNDCYHSCSGRNN